MPSVATQPSSWARAARGLFAGVMLALLAGGVPWALTRYIGWPLPTAVPTWEELSATLLNPMSAQLLLDVLACLCWVAWFAFVVDVVRYSAEAVRGVDGTVLRPGGAMRRIAAVLIGAVVVAILGRGVAAGSSSGTSPSDTTSISVLSPDLVRVTEVVRAPENGTHDSLWRVAERIWGDGTRWPELFEHNRGVPQPVGGTLVDPNFIRPGWVLAATVAAPSPPPPPPPAPAPPDHEAPPAPVEPKAPLLEPESSRQSQAGVDLVTGAFVSLGLAVTIATAVAIRRSRRRRRYRIGSADRTDLQRPLAPVVRALVIAAEPHRAVGADLPKSDALRVAPHKQEYPVGVHNGQERLLELATTGGLGLTGPGSPAAVRALLLHIIADRRERPVRVLVPQHDLSTLLGDAADRPHPAAITVTDSLDAALSEIDTELTTRTRRLEEPDFDLGTLVLVARPTTHNERRLRAVLQNGTHLGLVAVLIGQWPPGTTIHCHPDGTVDAATPGPGHNLLGTRLFTLPSNDTADLLTVLHDLDQSRLANPSPDHTASGDQLEAIQEPARSTAPPDVSEQPQTPLDLRILGRLRLLRTDQHTPSDLMQALAPKQREILVRLAIQPTGVRRETIAADIWPEAPGRRPYNSFHATLSQLRRALRTASNGTIHNLTTTEDGHYALDHAVVDVDLWRLNHILRARVPDPATIDEIVELYRGDLADSLGSEWLLAPREALRRDVLDALRALSTRLQDTPEHQLKTLEQMRHLDPHNESVYRDIIRIQARLDRVDAISRTMALLTTNLEEIGERPEQATLNLAGRLRSK